MKDRAKERAKNLKYVKRINERLQEPIKLGKQTRMDGKDPVDRDRWEETLIPTVSVHPQ